MNFNDQQIEAHYGKNVSNSPNYIEPDYDAIDAFMLANIQIDDFGATLPAFNLIEGEQMIKTWVTSGVI